MDAECLSGHLGDVEGRGDRGNHEPGIAKRREWHPEDAVGKVLGDGGGGLERESGLAGAAGTGQGEQPDGGVEETPDDRGELVSRPRNGVVGMGRLER